MPTLAEALVLKAEDSISHLQNTNPPRLSRDEIKKWGLQAVTMNPSALKGVDVAATYLREFADLIGDPVQAAKLHSWVTVMTAALGAQAIWNRILWKWAVAGDPPQGEVIHPDVKLEIDTLFPNYAELIAREP